MENGKVTGETKKLCVVTSNECACEDYERAKEKGSDALKRVWIHVAPLVNAKTFPEEKHEELKAGKRYDKFFIFGDGDRLEDHVANVVQEQPVPAAVFEGLHKVARLADWQFKRLQIHCTVCRFHVKPEELFREDLLKEPTVELDMLIVADAVVTPPDGKFYVLGGGLTRCTIPELPFPIPLSVLARLKVSDKDLDKQHKFLVQIIGPAGIPNVAPVEISAHAPPAAGTLVEGEESFFHFGMEIPAVAARAGLYHVEFHINGKLARSIPLPVVVDANKHEGRMPVQAPLRPKQAAKPKTKRPPPPPKKRRRH